MMGHRGNSQAVYVVCKKNTYLVFYGHASLNIVSIGRQKNLTEENVSTRNFFFFCMYTIVVYALRVT